MTKKSGALFIVATPIGNLQDMTPRALDILRQVDCIAAEDTRHTQRLLSHFGIKKPLLSLHDFNETARVETMLTKLKGGESIALVSDAGTPLIQDPGYLLVKAAHTAGVMVSPLPGACAAIAALSVSGITTDRFTFVGFLPRKNNVRKKELQQLSACAHTLIFYEAPHRMLKFLEELQLYFGDTRQICVARELTKVYESLYHGVAQDIYKILQANPEQQQGEFVVIVEGAGTMTEAITPKLENILKQLLNYLPLKQAVALTVDLTEESKNKVYQLALKMK